MGTTEHEEPRFFFILNKGGTQLTIRRADYSVKVVKRFNHIFFDTLRSKMMWGADGRR